jgi:4-amino-4-deoxychorismate lyase
MVNFYHSSFTYDYSFPAVTLAYFLRYPNPYSTHVLSTDVIDRSFDAGTGRLYTTRLHLKKSKLPTAVLKLLPRGFMGSGEQTQSFILEKSVVDIKEGWMETESRNLEWTGVLSVVEKQTFSRPPSVGAVGMNGINNGTASHTFPVTDEKTDVKTSVTLLSRFGQARWKRRAATASKTEEPVKASTTEPEEKVGFFKGLTTGSIQRSIELIGLKRTQRSQPNAKEGMKIVLQRMREGGLVAVLEGMRKDRETVLGIHESGRGLARRALGPGEKSKEE